MEGRYACSATITFLHAVLQRSIEPFWLCREVASNCGMQRCIEPSWHNEPFWHAIMEKNSEPFWDISMQRSIGYISILSHVGTLYYIYTEVMSYSIIDISYYIYTEVVSILAWLAMQRRIEPFWHAEKYWAIWHAEVLSHSGTLLYTESNEPFWHAILERNNEPFWHAGILSHSGTQRSIEPFWHAIM